ncbi:uncharacterized protein LOC109810796 isoform X3 [Cajanus cajan]|uniref:uncharacterized protein LOC109810796 isoform X3 n=1 Tax=Cajanus cajan TaxID=3821 RepID=UPI00098DBD3E|nr:uncharacterized protein LOC109810796 isoform X3 [Cajanus cajan]
MDLEDLALEFDWAQMDILNSIAPSLLNNPSYGPQQVTVPTLQDSVGTVVATPNQAQNTERAFHLPEEITTSSSMGNPPQLVADQLPQFSSNSSAPILLDETHSNYYVPSMVGLISDGAGSLVQGQNMDQMNYYNCNQFSAMQNNNLPPMMNDLGQQNELNTSNQLLMPNILPNQNFNGINHQPSSYPNIFQQNHQVGVEAGNETTNGHYMTNQRSQLCALNNHHAINPNIGNENTNGHFMTNQRSPLCAPNNHGMNNQAINPNSGWNSPRSLWMQDQGNEYNPLLHNPGFQQQSSTLNGPNTGLTSTFNNSSALNSAMMGLSGTMSSEGSSSQLLNMDAPQFANLLRPERAPGAQLQQAVNPLYMNTITPQRAGNGHGLHMSSSFGAQSSASSILSMLNQNDRSTVSSYGPYSTLQQNSSLNMPYERVQREPPRRGRPRKRFEPSDAVTSPYKRRKKGFARENAGKTPLSQANSTPHGVDQNANAEIARNFVNTMYDPSFERAGVPIDPLIRLLNKTSEKLAVPAPATTM